MSKELDHEAKMGGDVCHFWIYVYISCVVFNGRPSLVVHIATIPYYRYGGTAVDNVGIYNRLRYWSFGSGKFSNPINEPTRTSARRTNIFRVRYRRYMEEFRSSKVQIFGSS